MFLCLASLAPATTYYVDATAGHDTSDGRSPATAWKTLAKVSAQSFAPGDTIRLACGQRWREQLTIASSGATNNSITFGAYGAGAPPVISGANAITGWSQQSSNIWKAPCSAQPNIIAVGGAAGNRQTALSALAAARDWFWSGGTLYLYSTNSPALLASPGVEASARTYCIYADGRSHLSFIGLRLELGNRSCLRVNGTSADVRLDQVAAFGAGDMAGFEFDAVSVITLVRCSADYGRAVSVGDGFAFKSGCRDVALQGCTASYNHRRGAQFDTGLGGFIHIIGGEFHHQSSLNQSDGISIDANDGVLIDGAWCHDNGINNDSADGIQISGLAKNPVVRRCLSENNYNGGIILNADGGSIYDNISRGNRHGVAVCGNPSQSLNIKNNTCYENQFDLFFYQDFSTEVLAAPVNIYNNIFYGTSNGHLAMQLSSGLTDGAIAMDNNCLWGASDNTMISWKGTSYKRSALASFVSATGKNRNGIGAEPLFVNAGAGNFHLQAGSPCIDRGAAAPLAGDQLGVPVPQGAAPDLGALEYYGGAMPAGQSMPHVATIARIDPTPTYAAQVRFNVTFSAPVLGVSAGNFYPTVSGATIAGVSGSGALYTVTVNTGGVGALALGLRDGGTIWGADGLPLGGAGKGNGDALGSAAYNVVKKPVKTAARFWQLYE